MATRSRSRQFLGLLFVLLLLHSHPAFAQPKVIEPGFKLQVFTGCGRTFVPHPSLTQDAVDSECTPAESWGKERLLVSRVYSYDDKHGHIETMDRHGRVVWVRGTSRAISLAIGPPGDPNGHDLWYSDLSSVTRLAPDGTVISSLEAPDSRFFSGLDFDATGLFSPLAHIASFDGIYVLEPMGDPPVIYFPILLTKFAARGQMRFGPGGDWGTNLYNNGHVISPDGSVAPFPAAFHNFVWADGARFKGDMFSGLNLHGMMSIDRVMPDGRTVPWATGISPGIISYCDSSLWIIGTHCTKITNISIIDPPLADAGPDINAECLCPSGTDLLLSGALSLDDNSTPGTNDDIGKFEWFIDHGLTSEIFLGEGEEFSAPFSLGSHTVTLLVTDATDETSTDDLVVTVVNTNRPPVADAGGDITAECTSPSGAGFLILDGTASSDPDSTAGTQDDLFKFEWFEDLGGTAQQLLGSESVLPVNLGIGAHVITLKVTDISGLVDTDEMILIIADSTVPLLTVTVSPGTIWPWNGQVQEISATVSATDICGGASFILKSIASNEPAGPNDTGEGTKSIDVFLADTGTPDVNFSLRAERRGNGSGRIYTITYEATDGVGNVIETQANVLVPHDQGG
jgi:hypothetical protein